MPFEIIRNDITLMDVDAIVNTANPKPVIGAGVDSQIHEKAGQALLAQRKKIGDIAVGDAAITPGFDLNARYVIHTVGPVWRGGLMGECRKLRSCYETSLKLAMEHHCRSIAFPLISSGNYGFPKDRALQIAMDAISDFLMDHEMQIYLVVFDKKAFQLSAGLYQGIQSYIDQNYVDQQTSFHRRMPRQQSISCVEEEILDNCPSGPVERMSCAAAAPKACTAVPKACTAAPKPCAAAPMSLSEMLRQADAGFSETLLRLIDQSGKKDSVIYKRANLSKQHFSKIRNNPDYKPTKPTAIALALALELDLEQTKDLIGRAGFALSNSSKFDLIIRYFIENHNYDVMQINMALYEFDQALLGV